MASYAVCTPRPLAVLAGAVLCAVAATAHAATLTAGTAEATPNTENVRIAVTLDTAANDAISGIQFDLTFDPAAAALEDITAGSAAEDAQKSVSFNTIEQGRCRVIVAGLNQNLIGEGTLALLHFDIPEHAINGTHTITLDSLVMSDPRGRAVSATGTAGTLTITGGADPPPPTPGCGCGTTAGRGKTGASTALLATLALVLGTHAAKPRPRSLPPKTFLR
ncbi:MAG: cohesin domain-containing protein [Candidatus Hydrogenedentota bacterium]